MRIRIPPEGVVHEVLEGERLSSIARMYGFRDGEKIWRRPENEELRKLRNDDPNTLGVGDKVFIPPVTPKAVTVQTGTKSDYWPAILWIMMT